MKFNSKENAKKLRQEIIQFFNGKCSNPNCPIPPEKMDSFCLQIDHIRNDGRNDKRSEFAYYYARVLESIKNNEGKYQVLCVYCNWLKRKPFYGKHL